MTAILPKIAANAGHAFSNGSCRTVNSDKTTGNNRNGWPTVERMVAVDFVMECLWEVKEKKALMDYFFANGQESL